MRRWHGAACINLGERIPGGGRRWLTRAAAAREARNAQARSSFLRDGFVIIENAVDEATTAALRAAVKRGAEKRHAALLQLPKAVDIFRQQDDKPQADPMYSKFISKFRQVQRRKKEERRRQRLIKRAAREGKPHPFGGVSARAGARQAAEEQFKLVHDAPQAAPKRVAEATKDDVWEMSQRIARQLAVVPPEHSNISNDPSRLKAIDAHRCNVWMTDDEVKRHVFGAFGKSVGRLVRDVAGVRKPVLFGDRPIVREPVQRPTLLHCPAPLIGVEAHEVAAGGAASSGAGGPSASGGDRRLSTCLAWVMLDTCAGPASPFSVLRGSRDVARSALTKPVSAGGVDIRKLHIDFPVTDSDVSWWLQHFPALHDGGAADELEEVRAGSIVLVDPFQFVATGANFTRQTHVSLQLQVVSAEDAVPSVHVSSWVREWKPRSNQIDFTNAVIFPPLE